MHAQINTIFTYIAPPDAPKLPSVSVSSSAEIVEGSSVTLTCSSDANPAANYTWYKEDEDSPKASGQIFIITDFRDEHSGSYSCEAQNMRGRSNSTLHLLFLAGASRSRIGRTLSLFLFVIVISVYLWIRYGFPNQRRELRLRLHSISQANVRLLLVKEIFQEPQEGVSSRSTWTHG
ncbi:B-cell receptor CD22-like [Anarhichas minor]|uniref:B-cell receptor CD22-like n=1 Tax=Anarhichas minor TaxID=65739 RepID=UPI003F7381CB